MQKSWLERGDGRVGVLIKKRVFVSVFSRVRVSVKPVGGDGVTGVARRGS